MRHAKAPLHLSLFLPFVFFFHVPAQAGGGGGTVGFERPVELPFPDEGDFVKALSGEFTGDGIADLLVLQGTSARLVIGPDLYRAGQGDALLVTLEDPSGLDEEVWDMASFPRQGVDDADAFFTVGSNGLVQWHWLPNKAEFVRSPISGTWGLPRAVTTWHIPDTAYTWVLLLGGDFLTAYPMMFLNDSYFSPLPPRPLGTTQIDEIELYNRDADADAEILVVTHGDLDVYDLYETPAIGSLDGGIGGGAFAALDEPQTLTERLAWVSDASGTLEVWVSDADVIENPIPIGPYELHSVAAGDWDRDGYDDLFVATDSSERFVVYRNLRKDNPGGPTFSSTETISLYDLSSSPDDDFPESVRAAVFADMEQDRDEADLVLFDQDMRRGMLFRSTFENASDLHFPVNGGAFFGFSDPFVYELDLDLPLLTPADATAVEVVAWPEQIPGQIMGRPDFVATYALPEDNAWTAAVELPFPLDLDPHRWHIEIRMIRSVIGEPKKTYAPTITGLEVMIEVPDEDNGRGTVTLAGVLDGGTFPIGDIPPFAEGEVPIEIQ